MEQRFGRIHRIGQREVCHLWNLVAGETREGAVYQRLLEKIARERDRLNGQVFDVIGELFRETPLRRLMVAAVRYGDKPEVRDRLKVEIDNATDQERVKKIVRDELLVTGVMDTRKVEEVRAEMERAQARKLQPHFIADFFQNAFQELGGTLHERETGRFAINNVPALIRNHARRTRAGAYIAKVHTHLLRQRSDLPGQEARSRIYLPGEFPSRCDHQPDSQARARYLETRRDAGGSP